MVLVKMTVVIIEGVTILTLIMISTAAIAVVDDRDNDNDKITSFSKILTNL